MVSFYSIRSQQHFSSQLGLFSGNLSTAIFSWNICKDWFPMPWYCLHPPYQYLGVLLWLFLFVLWYYWEGCQSRCRGWSHKCSSGNKSSDWVDLVETYLGNTCCVWGALSCWKKCQLLALPWEATHVAAGCPAHIAELLVSLLTLLGVTDVICDGSQIITPAGTNIEATSFVF